MDLEVAERDRPDEEWTEPHPLGFGRPHTLDFRRRYFADQLYEPGVDPADPSLWQELVAIRQHGITAVGGDFGEWDSSSDSEAPSLTPHWPKLSVPAHYQYAPFDEPMLGIIGMWREGGGANPHFALAIAETMLRVGQRHIAWTAYERTKLLQERFSPDPKLREFLVQHCNQRQKAIARILGEEAVGQIESTFRDELKFGQDYQAAYHEFERQQIAKGINPGTEGFDKAFFESSEPIASIPGPEETYRILDRKKLSAFHDRQARGYAWVAAGICAMVPVLPSILRRMWAAYQRRKGTT